MAIPTDRASLKTYALRRLGFPVITINVDDDQVDDRIDEAIDTFQQWHFDGTTKLYLSVSADANIISNTSNTSYHSFTLPNTVIGVSRVFPLLGATNGNMGPQDFNIFDLSYQLRLNELYDFTSADYVYFELAQQHIRTLEMLFIGEPPIRYNRHDSRLYVDLKWDTIEPVTKIVVETFSVLPENNVNFWNDVWLKKYATCLVKEQWGSNLTKFTNVQLPGGMVSNGQKIYDDAILEKEKLLEELHTRYEEPPGFLVG